MQDAGSNGTVAAGETGLFARIAKLGSFAISWKCTVP